MWRGLGEVTQADIDAATGRLREYFDVSVYRNILDMLNTLDTTRVAVVNWIGNKFQPAIRSIARKGFFKDKNLPDAVRDWDKKIPKSDLYKLVKLDVAGPAFGQGINSLEKLIKTYDPLLRKAGGDGLSARVHNPQANPEQLLALARSLEWEMNRVRLPMPLNFRQFVSKLSGREYGFRVTNSGKMHFPAWHVGITDDGGMLPAIELLKALPKLKSAVAEMRKSVRREIDAAELAAQVQEETLRREEEEIIAREQAEGEAAARAERLVAQRLAQYRDEYELLLDRLQAVDTAEQAELIIGQLRTVVDAHNNLQPAQPLAMPVLIEQPGADDIADAAGELQQQLQAEIDALQAERQALQAAQTELAAALAAAQSEQDKAELSAKLEEQAAVIDALTGRLDDTEQRMIAASNAQKAAAAGDVAAAGQQLDQAAAENKGAALPLIGLSLLLLLGA